MLCGVKSSPARLSQSRKKIFSSTSRSPEEVQTEMISLYKCGDNGRSRTISVVWVSEAISQAYLAGFLKCIELYYSISTFFWKQ